MSVTLKELDKVIGPDAVTSDREELCYFSQDIFPTDDAEIPIAIVKPQNAEDVGKLVAWAQKTKTALIPRGGGVSYTSGYQTRNNKTVLLDLSGLNKVREINATDRYVVVDAGCTWETLKKALEGSGLRSALKGPISGAVSTVGGAASQNLPGSMEAIVGLEVVTGRGESVWTGAAGAQNHNPFYRNYGPDLTGLFLGDAGALGVKTAVALRLEPIPKAAAFASYGFETMAEAAQVMVDIAHLNLNGRVFALDPLKNKTSTKVSVKEGAETLKAVIKTGGFKRGLKDAAKIAMAGQNAFDKIKWSLHLTFEGPTQRAADDTLAQAKAICDKHGTSIEPSIPVAMYARSFSIRGFLGIKGERWVPLHGIFPLSKVDEAISKTQAFFEGHAERLAEHGIFHSFMLSANGPYMLIEPMFYWPDSRLEIHHRNLEPHRIKKMIDFEDNPEGRLTVKELREDLRDLYYEIGGISAQIGKFYPYRDILKPSTRKAFDSLKSSLDPEGVFNPGALQTDSKDK